MGSASTCSSTVTRKSCSRMRPTTTKMLLILIGKLVPMTMPLGVVVIGAKATLLAALAVTTTGTNPQLLKSLHPYLQGVMSVGKVLLTTLLQLLEIGLLELVVLVPLMLRKAADGNYKLLLNLKPKISSQ